MGSFLARLRGKPRIQPTRVKAVWNECIIDHAEYFHKVILNVCARDEGIRDILRSRNKYTKSEDEIDFVLRLLAERIEIFFNGLITDEILGNSNELKQVCYQMGKQHASYATDTFKLVYWDEFTLAMIEVLEDSGSIGRDDLRAWQTLLHVVNENMQEGYFDARSEGSNRGV
ncbi:glb-31 [Pristionchus pacificus]|uniref:Globin family profile domain-containing protein n=1 Tax=Pristionchus pacificus TaxID=54126 RepID=A0A8R1V7P4_PRIPA|nr:glb-31 [Pristionchus pacificus]